MRRGRVGILTTNHLSPDGTRMIYGGAERYAVSLTELLVECGFGVEWWQIGTGWTSEVVPGVPLRTIRETEVSLQMMPGLNQMFHEQAITTDFTIYFVTFLAYPQARGRSISLSHGIYWDHPSFDSKLSTDLERDEWRRRMCMALTGPDKVVSVDTATINWATATWPQLGDRFEYIPNFVDVSRFRRPQTRHWDANSTVRVLFPRRLTTVRGVNEVLRAAEVMTKGQTGIEFHIVGRAHDDRMERDMIRWAAGFDQIHYYWRPPHAMPKVYENVDIVLIPSKACEGTSLSCLEAMAAGRAVIATPVGGLGNLIIDGYNGLLVAPRVDELISTIDRLVRDRELRAFLGENGRRVAEAYSLDVWKHRWRRVFDRVFT